MPGTRTITNDELLALECDVLIPAALGNQIRQHNAGDIKANLIVEGANQPVTPAADLILAERGIPVLPDIVANAGGVTVSYFEWVQNWHHEQWERDEIDRRLRRKIEQAVDAIVERQRYLQGSAAPELSTDLRTAALVVAVERVANVTLKRGIWP